MLARSAGYGSLRGASGCGELGANGESAGTPSAVPEVVPEPGEREGAGRGVSDDRAGAGGGGVVDAGPSSPEDAAEPARPAGSSDERALPPYSSEEDAGA